MSKGHVFFAQNSDVDYVRQAYALALTIKKFNTENQTCLITDDVVPDNYKHVFDHIVPIPYGDQAYHTVWKIENRWKIIHATPFEENIVYDTDMLLLNSNDHWWKYFDKKDLWFTSNVFDYRGNVITSDFYRKTFTANNLPNTYVGAFYFKKVTFAYEFFKWLEIIVDNWEEFYKKYLPNKTPTVCSIDVSAALAIKFMDCQDKVMSADAHIPNFIHMKPAVQGWHRPAKWVDVVGSYMSDDCLLKVGNMQLQGLFHYVEDKFLTDEIVQRLEQ